MAEEKQSAWEKIKHGLVDVFIEFLKGKARILGMAGAVVIILVFGWGYIKDGVSSLVPSFSICEDGCLFGLIGGEDKVDVVEVSKSDAAPEEPELVIVDTRPCANDWIPGSCKWQQWRASGDEEASK